MRRVHRGASARASASKAHVRPSSGLGMTVAIAYAEIHGRTAEAAAADDAPAQRCFGRVEITVFPGVRRELPDIACHVVESVRRRKTADRRRLPDLRARPVRVRGIRRVFTPWELCGESPSCSKLPLASVGRRLPADSRYAVAACQVMKVTGRSDSPAGYDPPTHVFRSSPLCRSAVSRSRDHSGWTSTNILNAALVTSVRSMKNARTDTACAGSSEANSSRRFDENRAMSASTLDSLVPIVNEPPGTATLFVP